MNDAIETATWKDVVELALRELGGEGNLTSIYRRIQGHPKTLKNPTWNATVRRTLQQYTIFEPKGRGVWALKEIHNRVEPINLQAGEIEMSLDHDSAQGMLLNLGKLHRFETYAPPTDATARQFNNAPLADLITIRVLPIFAAPSRLKDFKNVDVIWLAGKGDNLVPRFAFEVEHTQDIKAALLRLYQFVASGLTTKLFVVGPTGKESKFSVEVEKTPFAEVREKFSFRSYRQLVPFYNATVMYEEIRAGFLG